ncbi:hypothetical protein ACUSIJ_11760 [Pseudochelatococcus sp. B33]
MARLPGRACLVRLQAIVRLPGGDGRGMSPVRVEARPLAFDGLIRQGEALTAIARSFLDDLDDRRRTEDEARRARIAADAVERDQMRRQGEKRRLGGRRIDRDILAARVRRLPAPGPRSPAGA